MHINGRLWHGRAYLVRPTDVVVSLFRLPITAAADELRDYGEYLAGKCTSCHRVDGTDKVIPSIVGWVTESFIIVMNSYKSKERKNAAMILVATSLAD